MQITSELFKYPFQDERWVNKTLVAGLLVLGTFIFFPIALCLNGYMLRIIRLTASGEPPALPEWDDWGNLFVDGLKAWVVGMIYGLPMLVPFFCAYLSFGVGFLPLILAGTDFADADVAVMLSAFAVGVLFFGVAFLLSWPVSFLGQAAMTRLAVTSSLAAALQFGETWALLRSGFKHFLVAFVVYMGVAFAISFLSNILVYTIVLACLYPFILAATVYYMIAMQGALLGQAYYHTVQSEQIRALPAE